MAIVTRYNGSAAGVVNIDRGRGDAPDLVANSSGIISTGIGKHPTAYKITGDSFTFPVDQLAVGGAVETILRTIQVAGTVVAYQVDATQMSVLCESTGWSLDANLQAAIVSIGNRALDANVPVTAYNFANVVVSSAGGIKLA